MGDNQENSDPNPKKRKAEGKVAQFTELPAKKARFSSLEIDSDGGGDDEESNCNICFEPWSNTGSHRISSLKCGHFFGFSCIEKWLNSTGGNDCPTCNEKATKRDIRHHYIHKLRAIDTGDRDRALEQVQKLKKELREMEMDMATVKLSNATLREENEKLKTQLERCSQEGMNLNPAIQSVPSQTNMKLKYIKRLEIMRLDPTDPNKSCRVLSYNDHYGTLVVSQPSQANALFPGFGVRRVSMLDKKIDRFLPLHKDVIRDTAFNPMNNDQLLSVSQDKTIRITNISSGAAIQKYNCENEIWSCCWHSHDPNIFFVGTKRSQIYLFDTRNPALQQPKHLEFPVQERRPIIGLMHVPKDDSHRTFPCAGLLVMTLGSLWFFEETNGTEMQFNIHKLKVDGLFWSFHFHAPTRLLLVNLKPNPTHSRHMVLELSKVNVSEDVTNPTFSIRTNIIFDQKKGGSYKERSFLRSILSSKPGSEENALVMYGRGSGHKDHKLVIQEVGSGSDRVLQEISIEKPILDLETFKLNDEEIVCILGENELHIYKWQL